ncbi:MAG: dephospho-CoA kinase [Tissierellia bacterium]|nr:dephospho-CoA kinase [Tissierellia bacterium]
MKQNNCKLIGLTGGIASGKSTVANYLIKKGYSLVDADKIARQVVEVDAPAYIKIVEEFGQDILLEDRTINRKALGKIIFSNRQAREKLNDITHPHIFQSIKEKVEVLSKENLVIFIDIPLLFEEYSSLTQHGIRFDEIWLVYVDKDTQIDRLMKRDNITREVALRKIHSQMDLDEKRKKASKIIDNRGDINSLETQIDKLLEELI